MSADTTDNAVVGKAIELKPHPLYLEPVRFFHFLAVNDNYIWLANVQASDALQSLASVLHASVDILSR